MKFPGFFLYLLNFFTDSNHCAFLIFNLTKINLSNCCITILFRISIVIDMAVSLMLSSVFFFLMVLHIIVSMKCSVYTVCSEQQNSGSNVFCSIILLYTHLQATFIYLKWWLNDTFFVAFPLWLF